MDTGHTNPLTHSLPGLGNRGGNHRSPYHHSGCTGRSKGNRPPSLLVWPIRSQGSTLLQPLSRGPQLPDQGREEPEAKVEEEVTSSAPFSSSSPDETVMLPLPSMEDDFKLFQDWGQGVAEALHIPLQEVSESCHKLVDILHSSTSSRVALPINEDLLDPADTIWQTPTSVLPKRADKKYVPERTWISCSRT